jgi:hypothetical protein
MGWYVITFAVLWLFILTMLVLDFAGIARRGAGWRCQGIGLLLMLSAMLINTFAQYRGWSSSRVHSLMWPVLLAAFVLVISGSVMTVRKRRRVPQAGYPAE